MNDYRLEQLDVLIELHNKARKNKWLFKPEPLIKNFQLMKYAQRWCNKIAVDQTLIHSDMDKLLKMGFNSFGENIACNLNSPQLVMNVWMESKPHRKNILNHSFTDIGCGMSIGGNGKLYWVTCFGKI